MKPLMILLLLVCSLLYCPPQTLANDLDQLLSILVLGTWEEGDTPYGTVTFTADGTFQAKMFKSKQQAEQLLNLEGTWSIKNSELQSVLTESSSPKAPVGEAFTDTIVQVNQTELVMIGVDGQRYSKFRVTSKTSK
jgi:hypothetical protein